MIDLKTAQSLLGLNVRIHLWIKEAPEGERGARVSVSVVALVVPAPGSKVKLQLLVADLSAPRLPESGYSFEVFAEDIVSFEFI